LRLLQHQFTSLVRDHSLTRESVKR